MIANHLLHARHVGSTMYRRVMVMVVVAVVVAVVTVEVQVAMEAVV